MRPLAVVCVLVASLIFAAPTPQFRFRLPQGCTLPFANIAPSVDGFAKCDNQGRMTGHTLPTKAKQLQAAAKNNFCADASAPLVMRFVDFTRLEDNTADLDLKTSREDLETVEDVRIHGRDVGEGTVVQLVAMMRTAHISDCRKPKPGKNGGEAVNCNVLGMDANDIHIVLMPLNADDETSECESVTAEMIPHSRPAIWDQLDLKTPTSNPVRVTGQLFYDDAHVACRNGKGSPARRTVWEIHPVYQLDVCTGSTSSACDAANASAWVPYDEWVTRSDSKTEETGKKQRNLCEAATPNQ
jgi:hypothetical protein